MLIIPGSTIIYLVNLGGDIYFQPGHLRTDKIISNKSLPLTSYKKACKCNTNNNWKSNYQNIPKKFGQNFVQSERESLCKTNITGGRGPD